MRHYLQVSNAKTPSHCSGGGVCAERIDPRLIKVQHFGQAECLRQEFGALQRGFGAGPVALPVAGHHVLDERNKGREFLAFRNSPIADKRIDAFRLGLALDGDEVDLDRGKLITHLLRRFSCRE